MGDIFDSIILCKKCNSKMKKDFLEKDGFFLRTIVCPKCNFKIIHPLDEEKYNRFVNLKNKEFKVKMRIVGNSYAVSIPKEIILFMNAQKKKLNNIVSLCFEEMDKLSLNFKNFRNEENLSSKKFRSDKLK